MHSSVVFLNMMPKCDRVLIVGDFNFHACSPDNLMAPDFLNIIDSVNLVQFERGHTLDLVLSDGLPVFNRTSVTQCFLTTPVI